jgi:hypothetical protein
MLKFYYNGIKSSDKEGLQKAYYTFNELKNGDKNIEIYKLDYTRFSKEIKSTLNVYNNSDSQTDYFENDSIYIDRTHPQIKDIANCYIKVVNRAKYLSVEKKKQEIENVLKWIGV